MKKMTKAQPRKERVLARRVARELTEAELREIAGGSGNTRTAGFGGDVDYVLK
ncbi:MAG: hypothetical protein AAGA48_24905 [Myxococcota bacterium]